MQIRRALHLRCNGVVLASAAALALLVGCTRVTSYEKPDQPAVELSSDVGAVTISALNAARNDSLFPAGGNLSISFKETSGNEADLVEAVYEIYDRFGFMSKRVRVIVSEGGGRPVAETAGGKPIHIDRGSRNVKHQLSIAVDRDVARALYRSQVDRAEKSPVEGSLLVHYLGFDGKGDSFSTKSLIATLRVDFSSDITPPPQVKPLIAQADPGLKGRVDLDWSGYSEPSDLDFYRIYHSTNLSALNSLATQVLTLLAEVPPGVKSYSATVPSAVADYYYFAVVATDIIANSIGDATGSVASVASTNLTF
jgi:hypothetical protein